MGQYKSCWDHQLAYMHKTWACSSHRVINYKHGLHYTVSTLYLLKGERNAMKKRFLCLFCLKILWNSNNYWVHRTFLWCKLLSAATSVTGYFHRKEPGYEVPDCCELTNFRCIHCQVTIFFMIEEKPTQPISNSQGKHKTVGIPWSVTTQAFRHRLVEKAYFAYID